MSRPSPDSISAYVASIERSQISDDGDMDEDSFASEGIPGRSLSSTTLSEGYYGASLQSCPIPSAESNNMPQALPQRHSGRQIGSQKGDASGCSPASSVDTLWHDDDDDDDDGDDDDEDDDDSNSELLMSSDDATTSQTHSHVISTFHDHFRRNTPSGWVDPRPPRQQWYNNCAASSTTVLGEGDTPEG